MTGHGETTWEVHEWRRAAGHEGDWFLLPFPGGAGTLDEGTARERYADLHAAGKILRLVRVTREVLLPASG